MLKVERGHPTEFGETILMHVHVADQRQPARRAQDNTSFVIFTLCNLLFWLFGGDPLVTPTHLRNIPQGFPIRSRYYGWVENVDIFSLRWPRSSAG